MIYVDNVFENISGINLLGSASCNLNCKYCYLHGVKSSHYHILNEKINEAWEDGSYIENVLASLQSLKVSTDNIMSVGIAGAEPFVKGSAMARNFGDIFPHFRKLKLILVSTNVTNHEEIINFLTTIFKKATTNVRIFFFCSIDGPEESMLHDDGHAVNIRCQKESLQKILEFVNKSDMGSVDLRFTICPTVNLHTLLTYFSEDRNIENYQNYFYGLEKMCASMCSGVRDTYFQAAYPSIAIPTLCTTSDGRRFRDILEKWDAHKLKTYVSTDRHNADILNEFFNVGSFGAYKPHNYLSPNCATLIKKPIFLPDGTIVDCPHHINDKNILSKMEHKKVMGTDVEEEELNWSVGASILTNQAFSNLTSGLMSEMALSGQIPFKYFGNHFEKLDTILMLSSGANCNAPYRDITGIKDLIYTGKLRFYLNGVIDYVKSILDSRDNSLLSKYADEIHRGGESIN